MGWLVKKGKLALSVVTIAHNEEKRIEDCLKSTAGWADEGQSQMN